MADEIVSNAQLDPATLVSAGYDLNYEPDGSSYTARQNLVDVITRELLGPIDGPDEILPFNPKQAYLIGHIAPVKLSTASSAVTEPAGFEEITELALDPDAAKAQRGVPATAADETDAETGDDDAEDRTPKQGLMLPASMGLRFQVPLDLASISVTASWGVYETFETEKQTKAGRPIRHYKRTPVEESRTLSLLELIPGETATVLLRESICLRIDRYDDAGTERALIEIALCNDRETPQPIPVNMWMFQTQLRVTAGGEEVFLPVQDLMERDLPEHDDEIRRLNLQYKDRLEFAIGRTCSADWVVNNSSRRAVEVSTTWLPIAETPQTRAGEVDGAMFGMSALSTANPEDVRAGLAPLVDGYGLWIEGQREKASGLPPHLRETAEDTIWDAAKVLDRLVSGLDFVTSDAEAFRCFQFMNRVMKEQRIASQVAEIRKADSSLSLEAARVAIEQNGEAKGWSWRPFQLAFILMQLGALVDPANPLRSGDNVARVELLFFPTGGGKTEAYLGLAAFTFAIRRRQSIVDSAGGPLNGNDGVAVLMRYTLRLLTAQQFQRATALVCAAEIARIEDESLWGNTPFRIGLWVGTDVSPKRFEEANEQLTKANEFGAHRLTVLQIQRCPWCGTSIEAKHVKSNAETRRIHVYCGDDLAKCPFSMGGTVSEGLPVLTVDEEIYRLTPAFVIATVDKFARLAREGEAASLFGYVSKRCERHGYVHPDYDKCSVQSSHPKTGSLPAASVMPVGRLRPPDLIIQDELHLITGALGTAVGLFEVVVETMSSWERPDGKPVKPLIVASTATVRNASEQVRALYGRRLDIFPPQVLDVADTFFSKEVQISPENPGRRYLGISAQGVRLSSAEIRIAEVLLLAGQLLFDRGGIEADPYMTLVGYFNATRELAGMRRYIDDDVANRVGKPRQDSGLPRRYGTNFGSLNVSELTSRIGGGDIAQTLDRLGVEFDDSYDTTSAIKTRREQHKAGKKAAKRNGEDPFDIVLATSMLQVGVDVQRLGLMLVVGQPKNTAEYIQASSRVGRDSTKRPGLVVALGNWARPRDLAHFEQFRHYHDTFYAQVEALSVTPYSPTSLDRGIDGVLVSATRVAQAVIGDGLSPERSAGRIADQLGAIEALVEKLHKRIAAAAQDEAATERAKNLLVNRIDRWSQRAKYAGDLSKTLVYERTGEGDKYLPLIISPENHRDRVGSNHEAPFVIANSMREVQPEINILVSPIPERLFSRTPEGVMPWVVPSGEKAND
jgi:hypothetical protein